MAETTMAPEMLSMLLALSNTDPDLKKAWEAYLRDDVTTATTLILNSAFYRNNNGTARQRLQAKIDQPGAYAQELDAYKATAKKRLAQAGVQWTPGVDAQLTYGFEHGMTDTQVDNLIVSSGNLGKPGGAVLGVVDQLKSYADSFGVSNLFDDKYWSSQSEQLFQGLITADDIQSNIRTTAASAYPAYANGILAGKSMDSQASAYKNTMATLLELDPNSISWTDPRLRRALQSPTPVSLYQFEKDIRSLPEWGNTKNARDTVDSLSLKVLQDWGLM